MRCPKCHYITFGSADRCRNCGYELSLAAPPPAALDLPIQDGDPPVGPMRDLQLDSPPQAPAEDYRARRTAASGGSSTSSGDLPLFSDRDPVDDTPLISTPGPPRTPLSVRRAAPAPPRSRSDGPADALAAQRSRARRQGAEAAESGGAENQLAVAGVGARLVAGAIDVLILGTIDLAVLYFTLRVLELPPTAFRVLPPVPLAVFLLLLDGGYLATFTAAGGQTIGKMIAGIRVIAVSPHDPASEHHVPRLRGIPLGAAVLRAAAYLVSLLPAGLGFAAILLDPEGRALHDRLADTRVVKA